MARKSPFQAARDAIERMADPDQLRGLKAAIERRLEDSERVVEEWQPPEGAVEVRRSSRGHYALEWVRCGKERCRCAGVGEEKHGPYWYFYRYVGGRKYTKSYVGRELPGGNPS